LDSNLAVTEKLSAYYLVEQFNCYIDEKVKETEVWGEWAFLINKLTDLGKGTYRKLTNLHAYQKDIKKLTLRPLNHLLFEDDNKLVVSCGRLFLF
jgi:hypothetical protein